jgi:LPS-assembly protein
MRALRFLAAVWLLAAVFPIAGRAQAPQAPAIEGAEIGIDAQEISYDEKANTVVARGKVIIKRGETELRADEVRLNRTTNDADARGNVSVTDPEGTLAADAMRLNLDEETGLLEQAKVTSRRMQYSLWGERIEKGLGQSYHIENGRFTTCHCAEGPQSWSVSGRDLRVAVGGYGTLRGGTFNVLDIPVLYIPRAFFPMQQERETGFLLPRMGVSNTRGFQTLLPFYWAINKSHDATLALDIETSARAGLVGEYRYALSRATHGLIDASYFNESFRGGTPSQPFELTVPEHRWSVVTEHDQPFVGTSRAYADAFLVGDDLFLREINTYAFEHARDVAIRTLPFTQSRVGVVQLWDRVAVKGEGTYYQNLTGPESQTLQRAPEVDLWGQGRVAGPVLGDFNAAAVDFQRSRSVGGLRVDVEPAATVPLPLGRLAFGAIRASLRETAYHLTDQTLIQTGSKLPQDQSRELLQVSGELGTAFSRVYPVHWLGLEKVKHSVEPELAYLYIPSVSQGDLPLFDGTDRVNHRNLLTYGVVNRFLGKFGNEGSREAGTPDGSVRELGRLSLTQSVDISRPIEGVKIEHAPDHFSDLDVDGSINPSRAFSLRFRTSYDTGNNSISAAKLGVFVEDPRQYRSATDAPRLDTRTSASVSYRFLTQSLLQEIDDNIVLRLTDWAGFLYASRYDVVANRFLDNYFGLRLTSTCDCWALDLSVTDRTNPQEVAVGAQLTLSGLGSSRPQSRVAAAP